MRRNNGFAGGYRHEYAYARGFESEFTAEELFNMFFGGGFPQQQAQTRYRRYNHQHEAQSVIQALKTSRVLTNFINATYFVGTIEPCFRFDFAVYHRINAFNLLHF